MKNRAYEIARHGRYDWYQRALASKIIRRKVYARFKNNIWAADLAEVESLPSKNKNVKYLSCVIDIFAKYACIRPYDYKLWVDQGTEFYSKLMQEWLDNNNILIDLTHNEGESVIIERVVKTSQSKIYKSMTANDTKSYLPDLNKLVDQYNNTYQHSINKKTLLMLIILLLLNPKAPRFTVYVRVRITKYQNIFSKGYTENWSKEIFIISSVLKTNPLT